MVRPSCTPPNNKLDLLKFYFMEKPVRVTDQVYIDALCELPRSEATLIWWLIQQGKDVQQEKT